MQQEEGHACNVTPILYYKKLRIAKHFLCTSKSSFLIMDAEGTITAPPDGTAISSGRKVDQIPQDERKRVERLAAGRLFFVR